MNPENFNIEQACNLAGIRISNSRESLTIRTRFNPFNKFGIGSLLFLILGFFMGVLAITHSNDLFATILGSALGFGIGTIALLSILSSLTSYFKISQYQLEVRRKLRLKRESLTKHHKVKMKARTDFIQSTSRPGSGSHFRVIELYIANGNHELPILDYQTDQEHATIANQLGTHLSSMIKDKLRSL